MRVVFTTPEAWLAEVAAEAQHVLGGVVRMRVDREPEQAEAVTHRVSCWLTAVIVNDSGPYLVEFGDVLGSDDGKTPTGGTDAASAIAAKLRDVCSATGLTKRDGKIEAV